MKYFCPKCFKTFSKWSSCSDHVIETKHEPIGKWTQQKCSIKLNPNWAKDKSTNNKNIKTKLVLSSAVKSTKNSKSQIIKVQNEKNRDKKPESEVSPESDTIYEALDLSNLCLDTDYNFKPNSIDELLAPIPFVSQIHSNSLALLTEDQKDLQSKEYGFIAQTSDGQKIYLNTGAPFCLTTVGVQGAGKSHSVAAIIENCMLNVPNYIHSNGHLATVVFHYDQDMANMCEAVTLTSRRPGIPLDISPVTHMTILVSPSFYLQRKAYYEQIPNCTVYPLLFKWKDLNASQIKSLMRVDIGENIPLYMSSILTMLRRLQKQGKIPDFATFKKSIKEEMNLSDNQSSPLDLRMSLLESLLQESAENQHFPAINLKDIFSKPSLVVVDLTDPMMSATEANGVFQVLLAMFLNTVGPKLVVFDEAHKYLDTNTSPLSAAIITSVRQMRHHGLRVVISSQSPKSIPAEILELSTLCLVHRFIAHDWFTYFQTKIHMEPERYNQIMQLATGQALLFYSKWSYVIPGTSSYVVPVSIRARITMDGGRSK